MEFELSMEERMLRDMVYDWSLRELGPVQEKIDDEDWMPPDFFRKLGELGILGITIAEEYGGSAQGILMQALAIESMSRVCPGLAMTYGAHSNLCANNIYKNGSAKQKAKYLPDLTAGNKVGALGLTEPEAGSDAMGLRTTAREEGDNYIVNGTKMFITNGNIANTILLYAKTDLGKKAKGISAFIVENTFPGFSVSKKIKKCGMRGSPTAELVFEDMLIPKENLVYEKNKGVHVMTSGLAYERIVLAGGSVGMAQQATEYSIKYAKERIQFGRSIGSFQMIQQKLADMYSLTEAARLLTYRAAVFADSPEGNKGGKGTELDKLAASAILFAAEAATKICADGVQIHGGYGYCLEYPIQKLWRDAKLYEIGAGTSEIRRLIVARELLR
jgi:isovaleryl-CoA dehydrogenase